MKAATATNPNKQSSTNDVPVLMDVLIEKRLKRQNNQSNQATSLNSQLTNQLRELRKANAALQLKNQKAQRYAERVQADRDEFRKQVIRLLHRSKLLEQQLEERHKPTWNEKISLELMKSKTPNVNVIKNQCSTFLQATYRMSLQIIHQIKEFIKKRNARRLESHDENSDKDKRKALNKRHSHNKKIDNKDIEKQHSLKKAIKHDYIDI